MPSPFQISNLSREVARSVSESACADPAIAEEIRNYLDRDCARIAARTQLPLQGLTYFLATETGQRNAHR